MAKNAPAALTAALRRIAPRLDAKAVAWALVGGVAVSVRSAPRFTRDLDLAVAVTDDAAAEAVAHALGQAGYVVHAAVEQAAAGRLATVRLAHRSSPEVFVDCLFSSSGIEPEIVAAAERMKIVPGLVAPVATTGHLIALKVLAESEDRPQDRMDLMALGAVATARDWADAEAAVRLIRARGFHRGRPLLRQLRAWRRRAS
jgi:hypothetical protein